MNFKTALLIFYLGAAPAFAADQSAPLTREQVRAELMQAMRSGEMLSRGESSMTLREINPRAYPAPAATVSKTRTQVVQELNQAIRTGEMLAGGESGAKLNEITPGLYPAPAVTRSWNSRPISVAARPTRCWRSITWLAAQRRRICRGWTSCCPNMA